MTQVTVSCPAHIRWVQDKHQIFVVDSQRNVTYCLTGIDAAIWGFFWLGYSYAQIVKLTAALSNTPPQEARARLAHQLRQWHDNGLLHIKRP
jgi:hypothetical protein